MCVTRNETKFELSIKNEYFGVFSLKCRKKHVPITTMSTFINDTILVKFEVHFRYLYVENR